MSAFNTAALWLSLHVNWTMWVRRVTARASKPFNLALHKLIFSNYALWVTPSKVSVFIKEQDTGEGLTSILKEECEIEVSLLRFHSFLGERRAVYRQSRIDSASGRKGHAGHSDKTSSSRWLDQFCPSLEFQDGEREKHYDPEACREDTQSKTSPPKHEKEKERGEIEQDGREKLVRKDKKEPQITQLFVLLLCEWTILTWTPRNTLATT